MNLPQNLTKTLPKKTTSKIIQVVRDDLMIFIEENDKRLNKNFSPNNFIESAFNYATFQFRTQIKLKEEFDIVHFNQYEFINFFGLKNQIEPLHIHIKNTRLFWGLFTRLIKHNEFPSFNYEMIKQSYLIKDRLKPNLEARSHSGLTFFLAYTFIYDCIKLIIQEQKFITEEQINELRKDTPKEVNKELTKTNSKKITHKKKESYILYRGIDIDKNQNIRVDRKKLNNPNAEKQDAGQGFSFTSDRQEAINFAIHKFIKDENSLGMNRELRFHNLSYFFEEQKISKDKFFDINNKRPYVVKYKIKHDDLILDLSGTKECEVVVDNEKAKIISYFLPRY